MKKSKILVSIVIGIMLITVIVFALSFIPKSVTPDSTFASAHSAEEYEKLNRTVQEKNAELIRNTVADPRVTVDLACGAFFRFIAGNKNPKERESVKRYIASSMGIRNPADIEIVLTRAEQYVNINNQIQYSNIMLKISVETTAIINHFGSSVWLNPS